VTGARLTAYVSGHVQGVGFRWWVRDHGQKLGLVGTATNLDDGRVEVIAEGDEPRVRELLTLLRGTDTPGRVTSVTDRWSPPQGNLQTFTFH
jgi:acylphosphatase